MCKKRKKYTNTTFKLLLRHLLTVSCGFIFSDDTGCPSSQCASPAKTPLGSENSPLGSPSLGELKVKVKRVRMNVVADWSAPAQKHKRQSKQHNSIMHKGDFKNVLTY